MGVGVAVHGLPGLIVWGRDAVWFGAWWGGKGVPACTHTHTYTHASHARTHRVGLAPLGELGPDDLQWLHLRRVQVFTRVVWLGGKWVGSPRAWRDGSQRTTRQSTPGDLNSHESNNTQYTVAHAPGA